MLNTPLYTGSDPVTFTAFHIIETMSKNICLPKVAMFKGLSNGSNNFVISGVASKIWRSFLFFRIKCVVAMCTIIHIATETAIYRTRTQFETDTVQNGHNKKWTQWETGTRVLQSDTMSNTKRNKIYLTPPMDRGKPIVVRFHIGFQIFIQSEVHAVYSTLLDITRQKLFYVIKVCGDAGERVKSFEWITYCVRFLLCSIVTFVCPIITVYSASIFWNSVFLFCVYDFFIERKKRSEIFAVASLALRNFTVASNCDGRHQSLERMKCVL